MRSTAILLLSIVVATTAVPVRAGIDLVVEAKVFRTPGQGPRVEVNLAMLAGSLAGAVNERGFRYTQAEVLTLVEQGGAIMAFSKVELRGTERTDTLDADLVHSEVFNLPPGVYDLVVEARDMLGTDTTVARYRAPLMIGEAPAGVHLSDIMFAERIDKADDGPATRHGHTVVPLVGHYFPSALSTLSFCTEVYGTDKHFGPDSLYLLIYQLERMEDRQVQGQYKRLLRVRAREVEPLMASFDIAMLPTGNYLLAVEVRDRRGELVTRREQLLQRNNPLLYAYDLQAMERVDINGTFVTMYSDADTLAEHIRSLRPIADPLERKIIDDRWKDRDMELMRRFFFSFWSNRAPDAAQAWKDYRDQVVKVNRLFSCRVKKGYETDRGYVYLKYGAPNSMMDRFNEMDAYPYTMWHYYRAGKYTNRRFVFYQSSLANDCLELLHSEVPGEVNNPRWNQIIHSRNVAMPDVDPTRVNSLSGERADEFFEIPR